MTSIRVRDLVSEFLCPTLLLAIGNISAIYMQTDIAEMSDTVNS